MATDPNDLTRRAEGIEDEVAPRGAPGSDGGADPDDDVAPDRTSTHD